MRSNQHGYIPDVGKVPKGVDQLLANRRPTQWVVDSFGARGAVVLLAGDSGAGKTSFLYRMADAISKGQMFMDQLNTVKSKVLIVQADESQNNAADKLQLMGIKAGFDFLFAEDGWNTLDVSRISQAIQKGGYGALFLDSLTTLLTDRGYSMREPEFARPLYDINNLASQLGVLIVCNAHLRKPDGTRQEVSIHDVIGSTTQVGAASDIWGLASAPKPEFDDHYLLKCLGKRNCEQGQIWNLQGSPEDFSWQLKSVGNADVLPQQKQELSLRVLQLVCSEKEWLTSNEIGISLGCNPEHARRICKNLYLTGELERQQRPSGGGRPLWVYGIKTFPT